MSFLSNVEHSVESGLHKACEEVSSDFTTVKNDVVNSARVGEVLLKGAWDYTAAHPGQVAETVAIAAAVGVVSGALTPLLPALAVVGVCAGLGAVGTVAIGINTYDAFKSAMPDLEIVWDADHRSKQDVAKAEANVEKSTGEAVTNLALLPVTFMVGNAAGNYGTLAINAATASEVAATATAATSTASDAALAACSETADAAVSGASTASAEAAASGSSSAAVNCPTNPSLWLKVENNPVFNFFSSPYVAKSDINTVLTMVGRMTSAESRVTSHRA